MDLFRAIALALTLLHLPFTPAFSNEVPKIAEKVALQAAMQRHIDDLVVDGAYLYLDRKTGKVRKLQPRSAHPIILAIGKYFVLCSEFQDETGKAANVDFYIARRNQTYIVFQSVVDDRNQLNHFRKSGGE